MGDLLVVSDAIEILVGFIASWYATFVLSIVGIAANVKEVNNQLG